MEDRSAPPASTSLPPVSLQTSITAQDGAVHAPQVVGCHIGGNVIITTQSHMHPTAEPRQRAPCEASHTGPDIILRVSKKLKSNLREKFETIFEGTAKRGNRALFREIYTELYITVGETEGVNNEHEVWQIDPAFKTLPEQDMPINCRDIFKPFNQQGLVGNTEEKKTKGNKQAEGKIRTVLTKGIAGIGKTVSVQKFILDWAEEKANQDIDLLFVLPFRELNSMINENYSLHELLRDFHSELNEFKDVKYYDDCKTLFIFDGLDESKLPFAFGEKRVSSVSKSASLDVLMTNIIQGNLLPSALVWITSRPAAIDIIPPDLIQRITEVRGFTDLQKEEYFRKRISDQSLASRIISHVRNARSLEIMCHIPVFCWIIATVLEKMLIRECERIPSSLTEMYTRFLLIQTNEKKKKYLGMTERDPLRLSDADVEIILKLGKLAFDKLQKSSIVFSEDDLRDYGIDITEASVRSGVFTEIVREEDPMFSVKKYSFVHLSFQEYLAAFFVFHKFAVEGISVMQSDQDKPAQNHNYVDYSDNLAFDDDDDDNYNSDFDFSQRVPQQNLTLHDLQKNAIHNTMKSRSGHLDLFLRFLLGLSMESNLLLLKSIPLKVENVQENIHHTMQYIKNMLREEDDRKTPSSERCINLFHCLLELDDHSMAEEIRRFLTTETQTRPRLTAAQCSTLAYIILQSREVLEELDLHKYNTSEEGRRRLVSAVRSCRRAVMADCSLTEQSCKTVASALQDPDTPLRELDLSRNFVLTMRQESLLPGLNSPYCRLENLNISYINLEKSGASLLRAVLMGPHPPPHTLKLCACDIKDDSAEILFSAFQSSECQLKELDISYNSLTLKGVKLVLQGLQSPSCYLEILRLSGSQISAESCSYLASALKHSFLRELILDNCSISDVGVKRLCPGLMSPRCPLQTLGLRQCNLSWKACVYLTVTLGTYSVIKTLNLRDNDLQDSGVKLLATGLKNPNCVLQKLGLSGCSISVEGCSSLASALRSNPSSFLRDLDLSYNHPGPLGKKLLSDLLHDPCYNLQTLRLDHDGQSRLATGFWKYYQELNFNYSHDLICSQDRKGVVRYQELVDMYDPPYMTREQAQWEKVSCSEELTDGRFYWEVQWDGFVSIALKEDKHRFRGKSLKFVCHSHQYAAIHEENVRVKTLFAVQPAPTPGLKTTGVYLDYPEGTLSVYSISSQGVNRLYTFHTTFNKPVIPEFHLARPDVVDELGSIIVIVTQSPESVQHTKLQLFQQIVARETW
ncbi:NACHT, LRR and PYD domains-containing protein 3 isoform X1 [Pangasianodon hypophthalmus]|uniref:NACHT, LRR and PYD domains-containing protein 3 isoform X1 n=2 Tax=Pangasianodon hypophthalmus TaxID=310915 RepID=UPI002307A308|nr:NACHT, LRR and PYD domains-containing protein 3 isoform X1 [Pangasianodon hypophthalmus]